MKGLLFVMAVICLMANGGLKALTLPDPAKLIVTGRVVRIRHDDNVPAGHNAGALAVKAAAAYIYGVRLTERQVVSGLLKSGQIPAVVLTANVSMGEYYILELNTVERLALSTSAARQSVRRWLKEQEVSESVDSPPAFWATMVDSWPFCLLALCAVLIYGHLTRVVNPKLCVRLSPPRKKRYRRLPWLAKYYAEMYLSEELGFESDTQARLMLLRTKSGREAVRAVHFVATVWVSAWHYQGLNQWRVVEEEAAELVAESLQNALVKRAPFVIKDIIIRPLPV